MEALLILLAVGIVICIKVAMKKAKPTRAYKFGKKRLLSEPEQVLYYRLKDAMPTMNVLPQVAFSRILKTASRDAAAFRKISQKVADFVVCDRSLNVLMVIELDDKSHNSIKDKERDALLSSAGIAIFRCSVSQMPSVEELKEIPLGAAG